MLSVSGCSLAQQRHAMCAGEWPPAALLLHSSSLPTHMHCLNQLRTCSCAHPHTFNTSAHNRHAAAHVSKHALWTHHTAHGVSTTPDHTSMHTYTTAPASAARLSTSACTSFLQAGPLLQPCSANHSSCAALLQQYGLAPHPTEMRTSHVPHTSHNQGAHQ
jgi:hypothetical protein